MLGHDSAYIFYDESVLGKGKLLSRSGTVVGGEHRPMVVVWFPDVKLIVINVHAEHGINLKKEIANTFYLVMQNHVDVKEDDVDRIILLGDFNDINETLDSIHLFGYTLKQYRKLEFGTCCTDSNYAYKGDYILDSDFNLMGFYGTPPSATHPYAFIEEQFSKLNNNNPMSDHDPVVFFPGL